MSNVAQSRKGVRKLSRPRLSTVLAFAGGVAVAVVLLPSAVTAATNQSLLNVLISDPENPSQQATVDGSGALRVSASGTSTISGSVNVTNTPLPVDVQNAPLQVRVPRASRFFAQSFDLHAQDGEFVDFAAMDVSLITFPSGGNDEVDVSLFFGEERVLEIADNENTPHFMALTQPIRVTRVLVHCRNEVLSCQLAVNLVGS